jgi:hypothetical protein
MAQLPTASNAVLVFPSSNNCGFQLLVVHADTDRSQTARCLIRGDARGDGMGMKLTPYGPQ